MITVYPYAKLGHANHGWLDARHHFSFASYRNPARRGFGKLLVINDDRIAAGTGFGAHSHDNMEIITYVKSGAITHQDSLGNEGRTEAGDVQVMSAGSGITHAEHNRETVETTLYQIWIEPNRRNIAPRWETARFPREMSQGELPVLVSGQARHAGIAPLAIYQDAAVYAGRINAEAKVSLVHPAYVLASKGGVNINGTVLQQGDGAEVTGETVLTLTPVQGEAEVLVIEVPV